MEGRKRTILIRFIATFFLDFPALMVNKAVPGGALLIAVMAIKKKKITVC